jgi:hypothetical protein
MSSTVTDIEQLIESQSENATVQLIGGIVLQSAGKTEEALSLLSKHQGSLEVYGVLQRNDMMLARPLIYIQSQHSPYRSDPPPTKPHRSRLEGGPSSPQMGTRQSPNQHRRIMGRLTPGTTPPLFPFPTPLPQNPHILIPPSHRAATATNKRSTSTKKWPKHPPPPPQNLLSAKQ